jgi:hypothetical protein
MGAGAPRLDSGIGAESIDTPGCCGGCDQ